MEGRKVHRSSAEDFGRALAGRERRVMSRLTSPIKIQAFLDSIPYSADAFYRCPLRVLRDRVAHCFDGALFAAAALRCIGYLPLIVDMLPDERDDEHLLAVYRLDGCWGAVAKSNFVGLRYREPVYRNLRELVMSYFEQYYNVEREKTLRGYTRPLNLTAFDRLSWMTEDDHLEEIAERLDHIQRTSLLRKEMVDRLSLLDRRSSDAGLFGANRAGLYKPGGETKR